LAARAQGTVAPSGVAVEDPIVYVPIASTVLATAFTGVIFRRYRQRGGTHLLWWALGMLTFGAGTFVEAWTALLGWSEPIFRAWYITGALLGGAPPLPRARSICYSNAKLPIA
jgi:hypothetical protein